MVTSRGLRVLFGTLAACAATRCASTVSPLDLRADASPQVDAVDAGDAGPTVDTVDGAPLGTDAHAPPDRAPRLLAPQSTATVTTESPSLRFETAPGSSGVLVQLCADRACARVLTTFLALRSPVETPIDLPRGVVFWRVLTRDRTASSATWQFNVRPTRAPRGFAHGTTLDLNGDGFADIAASAPGTTPSTPQDGGFGRVFVHYGSAAGPGQVPDVTLTAPEPNRYGLHRVANAGDLDGDGYPELVAVGNSTVYVYRGGRDGIAMDPATTLAAPPRSAPSFGSSIASAGDLDGDGYGDLVVAAEDAVARTSAGDGAVFVYMGGPGGVRSEPAVTLTGDAEIAPHFGSSVASAGDLDGDGYDDLLVGAKRAGDGAGRVYVYFGGPAGLTDAAPARVETGVANGSFGSRAFGGVDLNNDGWPDFAATAEQNLLPSGVATVFAFAGGAGRRTLPRLAAIAAVEGGNFGTALAGVGDVNGDGYEEFIVGTPCAVRVGSCTTGRAHVFAAPLRASPAPAHTLRGVLGFGVAATGAGDVNGDGLDDVLVGSHLEEREAGRVHLYLGSADGLSETLSYSLGTDRARSNLYGTTLAWSFPFGPPRRAPRARSARDGREPFRAHARAHSPS